MGRALRMLENRVLRRIFGPKRDEVTRDWRTLQNVKLHNLYSFTNIIRQIKSRRIGLAGHLAHMGEKRKCTRFWWKSLKERDHSEDRGVDGRMGSELVLRILVGGVE
jgi:hypothetical protein